MFATPRNKNRGRVVLSLAQEWKPFAHATLNGYHIPSPHDPDDEWGWSSFEEERAAKLEDIIVSLADIAVSIKWYSDLDFLHELERVGNELIGGMCTHE